MRNKKNYFQRKFKSTLIFEVLEIRLTNIHVMQKKERKKERKTEKKEKKTERRKERKNKSKKERKKE